MADVFIGGVQGFDSLGNAQASQSLRATNRVGLYLHANGVSNAYNDGSLPSIVAAFADTNSGIAELPYAAGDAAGWFATVYQTLYVQSGLVPTTAAVDVPTNVDAAGWQAYLAAAFAAGIKIVAPIFSPNFADSPLGDFATLPQYANIRSAALSGGGLTLDTPPNYAMIRGQAYIDTVESEVRWARANGLQTTVILSPYNDYGVDFANNTARFVAQLAADGALPDNWVVETYSLDGTTVVGSENNLDSVAGVALWLAQNADTAGSIPTGAASVSWTTPIHLEVGGAGLLTVNDTGGQAYVVGGAGGVAVDSTGTLDEVWTAGGTTNTVAVGASATIVSKGTDSIGTGANANVTVDGTATILGGSGSNTYSIHGTATVTSQATGSDMICLMPGATANVSVTGAAFTLMDWGGALTLTETGGGDENQLAASGGQVLIYGGAGVQLCARTNAGQATMLTLGAGNQTVVSQGNDTIQGGTGSDHYIITGNATLTSRSAGSDLIELTPTAVANVTVTGNAFDLMNWGGTVNLTETGGGDNDQLTATGGQVLIYGGAGVQLCARTNAGQATKLALGTGDQTIISQGNDTIQGGTGSDHYIISSNATLTSQSAGCDLIEVTPGATANVTATGNAFFLMNWGGNVDVTEAGGGLDDQLAATGGQVLIFGGAGIGLGARTNAGQATALTLGGGNQTIISQGNDTIQGGTGSDHYIITGNATLTSRSAGSDLIELTPTAVANVTVTGNAFDLMNWGGTVNLTETGGGDNDQLTATGGQVLIYGGAGVQLCARTNAGQATKLALGTGDQTIISQGNDTIQGGTGSDHYIISGNATLTSQSAGCDLIEVTPGATANVTATGNAFFLMNWGGNVDVTEAGGGLDDQLAATGGQVLIFGGAGIGLGARTNAGQATALTLGGGNQTIISQGNDTIQGGTGSDHYIITGNATLTSRSAGSDLIELTPTAVANVTVTGNAFDLMNWGGTVNLTETGGGDNDQLTATGGQVLIYGGAGVQLCARTNAGQATKLALGTGDQTIISQGNDTIQGGTGSDHYIISGNATLTSQSAGSDLIEVTPGATANVTATGKAFALMDWNGTVHVTESGAGDNDQIDATSGQVLIYGGAGNGLTARTSAGQATTLKLGSGNQTVVSQGSDAIQAGSGVMTFIGGSGSSTIVGGSGSLLIHAGAGNLTIAGSSAGDTFYAGTGTVSFTEGAGNDVSYLGTGNATVVGGRGIDSYHFQAAAGVHTIDIQNFQAGRDSFDFTGFNGNAVAGQAVIGGSVNLSLTDGTTIIFQGVARLS